jgi:ABC-type nitrate/sulfonate/bicarbonate transport system substrate-binding protein
MKKLIIILSIIILSFSCSKTVLEKEEITIQVPMSVSSIPLLEMDGEKIGDTLINVETFTDHSLSMAEFIRGDFDLLLTGFTLGLSHYSGNNDIYLAATPVWGVSSMITKDSSIENIQDLGGRTVTVPWEKSPLDLQLKYILKANNLLDSVNIEYSVIQQSIPLLLEGRVDGISVPEPLASKLILRNNAYSVFKFADEWGKVNNGEKGSPQVSLFVKKDFADKYPDFIKQVIEKIDTLIIEIQGNFPEYAQRYADFFNMPADVIELGIENTLYKVYNFSEAKEISQNYIKMILTDLQIDDGFYFVY